MAIKQDIKDATGPLHATYGVHVMD